MKLTTSNTERLESVSTSVQYFGSRSLVLSTFLRVNGFLYNALVKSFSSLDPLSVWFFVFERFSLTFLREEVLNWEQEKFEWIVEKDEVAKLL